MDSSTYASHAADIVYKNIKSSGRDIDYMYLRKCISILVRANPYITINEIISIVANGDSSNVYRHSISVNEGGRLVYKDPLYISPSDIQNQSFSEMEPIYADPRKQRYCNRIPIWQYSMNRRHYVRGDEGYRRNDFEPLVPRGYGADMEELVRRSQS